MYKASYLAENTVRLHLKEEYVKAVRGNDRDLLRKSFETYKYAVLRVAGFT
jgi:hypothetical protein